MKIMVHALLYVDLKKNENMVTRLITFAC